LDATDKVIWRICRQRQKAE